MNRNILRIDVSNTKYKTKDEDLINIRFKNDEVLQVNFSKLVSQSKYVRDNYNYTETSESIQQDIEKIKSTTSIKEENIKLFMHLIQDEKVDIAIEAYNDIYALSKYFCIPKIIQALDEIRQNELFQDINFSIEILYGNISSKDTIETYLSCQIETFLSTRINECIENSNFEKLPISTIYRIIEKSNKKVINHNALLDFIISSIEKRFILFKFVEFHKMEEHKIYNFLEFIEKQAEEAKTKYIECIPFSYLLIQQLKLKYDELNEQMKTTSKNLEEEQDKHKKTKEELKQEQKKHEETQEELKQERIRHEQTKKELEQEQMKHEKTKEALKQELINHDKTKKELDKREKAEIEKKKYAQSIIVGGCDKYNNLGKKFNRKDCCDTPIIHPSEELSLDCSSILSYSANFYHSVIVTKGGSLLGIGDKSKISSTFNKTGAEQFTEFVIKDRNSNLLTPISAVCTEYGTLYMFVKENGSRRMLVLHDCDINGGNEVFLDIGTHNPVALFGGFLHTSAICQEGEIIFINRNSVKKSPNARIESVSLPNGERASSIACLVNLIFVLSTSGRLFSSKIENESNILNLSEVVELSGQEIVNISGTRNHCIAVSKEGCVYVRGINENGCLGIGEGIEEVSSFTQISSLNKYKIRSGYAGSYHSLFETREGKILSCGWNCYGELLLSKELGGDVYSPTETTIIGGATFCIAYDDISAVFIGGDPPPNTPNMRVQQFK